MSQRATVKGAQRTTGYLVNVWLVQHAQAFLLSLRQIKNNPFGTLIATAVIGVSLSLPAGFYLLLNNASALTENWAGGIQISLFLNISADQQTALALRTELLELDDVKYIEIIDRERAFEEYRQYSGFSTALDYLEENPLPYVLIVYPEDSVIGTQRGRDLLKHLAALEPIDSAQFDRQWANRMLAMIEILGRGIYLLSTLLAFAVLLIVGNTIRLGIFHRRAEIEINKLFGATDAFIQRPFLYSGFIHGLSGSVMAWLLLFACVQLLEEPVGQLSRLYDTGFLLQQLSLQESAILILFGALLGLSGSWIAVKQHLRHIDLS